MKPLCEDHDLNSNADMEDKKDKSNEAQQSQLRQTMVGGSAVLSSGDRPVMNGYCVVQGCGERGQRYIMSPWGEHIGPYCEKCASVRDGLH